MNDHDHDPTDREETVVLPDRDQEVADHGQTEVHGRHRHPLRLASLVLGLVYLGIAAIWAVAQVTDVTSADLGWLVPSLLILAGAVGLLALALSQRSGSART